MRPINAEEKRLANAQWQHLIELISVEPVALTLL